MIIYIKDFLCFVCFLFKRDPCKTHKSPMHIFINLIQMPFIHSHNTHFSLKYVYLIADLITIILNHLDFKNPLCISLFPDSINSKSHHLSLFNSVEYFIKCCPIIYNSSNNQFINLFVYQCHRITYIQPNEPIDT